MGFRTPDLDKRDHARDLANVVMPLVSIEQDKRYRRVDDRYAEICVKCGKDRDGKAEGCACGAVFAKPTSNFLKLAWTPTSIAPKMPDVCPHCDRATERLRSITLTLPTGYNGGTRTANSRFTIEFGTCKRVPPPYLMWLAFVTAMFFVVVFGLAALFGNLRRTRAPGNRTRRPGGRVARVRLAALHALRSSLDPVARAAAELRACARRSKRWPRALGGALCARVRTTPGVSLTDVAVELVRAFAGQTW